MPNRKAALIEAVHAATVEAIRIPEHEVPVESWGMRGGRAACDVDLGFEIRV